MAGMLTSVKLSLVKVPSLDAFVAHESLLGDPQRHTARLGPAGYAQAVAIAAQRADAATAAYRDAWTSIGTAG